MQTRRTFLLNSLTNLATFTVGGGLIIAGKEQIKEIATKLENPTTIPKEPTDKTTLPTITINHTTDFALGGVLGLAVKKVAVEIIKSKQLNKELSSTVKKLQQLENTDLPGIKKALQEFVGNEDIKYEINKDSDLVQSILGLVDAISIHVNAHNKTIQPFLEELQKLRTALSQPFTEQLQRGGDVDIATKEAVIQVLRSDKFTECLETTVINALQKSGVGDDIGKHTASSLAQKDLVSDDGVIALQQTIVEVFRSRPFMEALSYAISAEITEYDIADRLMDTLLYKLKNSVQDDDADLVAFKNSLADVLRSEGVSEKLNTAVCKTLDDPNIARELIKVLQKSLLK